MNEAVEKGPGRPGLAPVADSMADEEKLAYAVGVAPFAGIVAGLIKAGNYFSSSLSADAKEKNDE